MNMMDNDKIYNVHFVEYYYRADETDEAAPLLKNEGDALVHIYTYYQPTDEDIEEALQVGGWLVARDGGMFCRQEIELEYSID